jgi:hypothetical protein
MIYAHLWARDDRYDESPCVTIELGGFSTPIFSRRRNLLLARATRGVHDQ